MNVAIQNMPPANRATNVRDGGGRGRGAARPVVCQVLHSLNVGGAEMLAANLARTLRREFDFVFACLDEAGEMAPQLVEEGFQVSVLSRRPGFDLGCLRQLGGLARRRRVSVIHAHQYTPFFYCAASRWLRGSPPILFTEHGRWHPDYPRPKRIAFNRLALRRSDRVVGVGQAVCNALIENEGLSPSRVKVLYNGIDLERFGPRPAARQKVRRELGLADGEFVLIQVARLDQLKDHSTAIRTMRQLAGRGLRATLLLAGEGPERRRVEHEIARLGLGDCVRLLGTRSDIPRLLSAADAFLLTSISEGIPLTLIEAMAAELPVVATDVGGVAEVVTSETGLLAPAGDDAALAQRVAELAADGPRRRALGEAGRRRALEVFSDAQMHDRYAALYREMLRTPKPSR